MHTCDASSVTEYSNSKPSVVPLQHDSPTIRSEASSLDGAFFVIMTPQQSIADLMAGMEGMGISTQPRFVPRATLVGIPEESHDEKSSGGSLGGSEGSDMEGSGVEGSEESSDSDGSSSESEGSEGEKGSARAEGSEGSGSQPEGTSEDSADAESGLPGGLQAEDLIHIPSSSDGESLFWACWL